MHNKTVLIATVGKSPDHIFAAAREIAPSRIILLTEAGASHLPSPGKLNVKTEVVKLKSKDLWTETFAKISALARSHGAGRTIVAVDGGPGSMHSAAVSACFVNGIRAFTVVGGKPVFFPIMRFGYQQMLGNKKLEVLREIHSEGGFDSLDRLGRNLGMSLPLISYHVNGNAKSEGLVELGLVSTEPKGGRVRIGLTPLGSLLTTSWT